MKHVPFMLDQTWIPLALVMAIGIGLGFSWQRIGGSRSWSQCRTSFARITGLVAAAIPLTMVVLGTMWFNDHAIETLEGYDPYVPQWLLRLLDCMWWAEVLTLASLAVASRQARSIVIPLSLVQAVLVFAVYFVSVSAVTGSWL